MINISRPLLGEEEKKAVLEVLDSGMLAQGERVKEFEEAFAEMCGTGYAVATSSGTAALHTALLAHGIGPGDEVITTPFTFIASSNSILYSGARPVFVDINPRTFNLDPQKIEAAITANTRAILPVHLFGLSCEMDEIMAIATKYHLVVIEDACQSHGASYLGRKVGSFGTGAFSLYPTKNITSAEGGMITTNLPEIANKCRLLRQHGMERRYYHDELGFNYRMSDVHAAIGLAQLKKLEGFNRVRRENASYLNAHLKGVVLPFTPEGCIPVFHQYTIRISEGQRDKLRASLQEAGIHSEIYYPVPVHRLHFYERELGYILHLPYAEQAAAEVLSLPVHPALTRSELDTIIDAVNSFAS